MKRFLLLLISVSTIVISTAALPFTFYVNPGDRIQEAIDIAIDGDTIIVRDGTYTGEGNRDIDFHGKAITLRSENGPDVTIIDCQGTRVDPHRGFYFGSGEGPNSVVDGFTITNGFAAYGGGICCTSSNPTINNCAISDNSALGRGGGIYCRASNALIVDCVFKENDGEYGVAMSSHHSDLMLINCSFVENVGGHSSFGGGIFNMNSSMVLMDCLLRDNAAGHGGALLADESSNSTLINCTINGNYAYSAGGIISVDSSLIMTGCTITENYAHSDSGGIYISGTASITNCTIAGNSARYVGGINIMTGDITITNSIITENMADVFGGGVYCKRNSSPTFTNCTISGNSAGSGGGMYCNESTPTLTNCILWGDSPDEVYADDSSYPTLNYCDIEGGWSGAGSNNIDEDPMFVRGPLHDYYLSQVASGQDADSPCIDAGSDTAENLGLNELSTRTDGMPDTGRVDMGYHAPYALWIHSITRGSDDITIRWNALPGVSYTVQLSTDLERWMSIPAGQTDTWTDTNASGYRKKFYRVLEQ